MHWQGESKEVASRSRKEGVDETWEERSRPLPPLTWTLPATLCSQHPCEAAQAVVLVLSPQVRLWLAGKCEAGRGGMELNLKADRPRSKDQQDGTNHGSVQSLRQTRRPLFANG